MARRKTKTLSHSSAARRDYCAIARDYGRSVLSGEIPACEWVRLACERQERDLKRSEWAYRFDQRKAEAVCIFIEYLPHVKGRWGSDLIQLLPWQVWLLTTVFGWVDADGYRRFRTAYTEVPRKNAKSTLSSGVALYLLGADGEPGPEVYSLATTRDQARIVFDDARAMARRTPELCEALGIEVLAHAISIEGINGTFRPLSSDAQTLDGLNIHGAIIDEFHAHSTRAVWDVVNSATGSRLQALRWVITTAGFNRSGVCFEQRDYVTRLLRQQVEDETYFGVIWTIDDGDDWTTEAAHRKANPNYGISVIPKDIQTLCRQAQASAQSQNNFLTKRLNVWVSADTAFFNMQSWDRCRSEITLDQFDGCECYIGLDLASKNDLAAKELLFRRDGEWYWFNRCYLPEDVIEDHVHTNCAHYAGWARSGRLTLTPGNIIDYEWIERDLLDDLERFRVLAIVADPSEFTYLGTRLQAAGAPVIEYPVNVANYSDPMKELEALILAGKIHHDGDPLLAWSVSNVVAHMDARERVFPRKERVENKIDPVTAAIGALGYALRQQQNQVSFWTV